MSTYKFKRPKREIDRIFLHCSATNIPSHDDVEVIRRWHKNQGWSDIGYHFFNIISCEAYFNPGIVFNLFCFNTWKINW